MIKLFPHQQQALDATENQKRVAYYLDMGLGKTFVGSEKAKELNEWLTLVVCQKSLIDTWVNHFKEHYPDLEVLDMTNEKNIERLTDGLDTGIQYVAVINYDILFRRNIFLSIEEYTLILDESSLVQNDTAKRTKFVLKMKPKNVILLSGTPTSGKYENLWTQLHLLNWNISKNLYEKQYVNWKTIEAGGFIRKVVDDVNPYKNVERLKAKLRRHGAVFMKTEEVFDLPSQNLIDVSVASTKEYTKFKKDEYIYLEETEEELIGDTILSKRLYLRVLAAGLNPSKWNAFEDLIISTQDRLIVFYNFNDEVAAMRKIAEKHKRPTSFVNGRIKDLENYEDLDNSITFIQYQAGSMGLNLQKANKIIYFSPTEKSELFEQSKKRIHRIGQDKPCFYYLLTAKGTIEEDIYKNLEMRKDYTDELFREYEEKSE